MKKIFLICLTIFLLLAANAFAAEKPQFVPNELIVKFKNQPAKVVSAAETGIATIDELNSKHKINSIKKVIEQEDETSQKNGLNKIFLLKTSENEDINEVLKDYNNDPNVEYAEPNYIVNITLFPNDPSFNLLYGLHNTGQIGGIADADIDAPEAWNITTGSSNVIVAVIDTGIDYNHPDLAANIWTNPGEIPNNGIDDDNNGFVDDVNGWNFANNNNNSFDDNGHGTHVAGTIGAVGNNGKGVAGVDWNVRIMPIRFLDALGSGSNANAIRAIQYATQMHADIMSNSWGGGGFSQALKDAITAANDSGILFVAAAGNDHANTDVSPNYPSSYDVPNIISVAATDDKDILAFFSNYGASSVDLGAPGVNIYSTVPNGSCQLCDSSSYRYLSGTSMATPHVSGVAALIKTKFPSLKSDGIKARLLVSVDMTNSLNGITVTGGRLNAFNSLETDTIPPAAVTDLTVQDTSVQSVLLAWTSTGDDGTFGTASSYDLRYSKFPIDNANWNLASKVSNLPKPQPSGSKEIFEVKNLLSNTTYYFALKVIDNVGNPSDLSNIVNATLPYFISDTFNRADSSILGNGWNEVSGDFQILNNQLRNVGIGTHKAVEDGFFGFNLSAAADFASINNIHGPRFGIMLRYQDPNNYYLFYRSVGGSSTLRISKVVNGVETILVKKAISNPSINVPFRIEGRVVGNTLTFYLNGLKKAEIIDSTFSSGKSGIYVKAPSAKSHIVDNFFATAFP